MKAAILAFKAIKAMVVCAALLVLGLVAKPPIVEITGETMRPNVLDMIGSDVDSGHEDSEEPEKVEVQKPSSTPVPATPDSKEKGLKEKTPSVSPELQEEELAFPPTPKTIG